MIISFYINKGDNVRYSYEFRNDENTFIFRLTYYAECHKQAIGGKDIFCTNKVYTIYNEKKKNYSDCLVDPKDIYFPKKINIMLKQHILANLESRI